MKRDIILIVHNVRSCHNVGSLLRTADGLGVRMVYLTGYTPYPEAPRDSRLPHLRQKVARQIHKTALGAEQSQSWEHRPDIKELLKKLQAENYSLVALEQANNSLPLPSYTPPAKVAIIVGHEVEGLEAKVLKRVGQIITIPMFGKKESFNVVQATAMALYHCRFAPNQAKA